MTIETLVARYGLVAGGLLAHQGLFPLTGAMAAAAVGSFAADQGWFAVGRRFRDHRLVARARNTAAFGRAVAAVERHPVGFVFAFRFLYGLRTVSPIAIGTAAVPARLFVAVNAVSAIVWGIVFSGVGYLFGNAFERLVGRLHPHGQTLWWIVGGLVAAGIAAAIVLGRRR